MVGWVLLAGVSVLQFGVTSYLNIPYTSALYLTPNLLCILSLTAVLEGISDRY
jgi:hypothetical protein